MKRILAVASTLALAVTLTGCELPGSKQADRTRASQPAATNYPAALAKFYTQKLDWQTCDQTDDADCAKLTVPVDYAKPDGATLQLAVLKVSTPATKKRKGSLIVNPGGPGGSGVDYAMMAQQVFSGELARAYDVVGFDPRGVARSQPIECLDGPQFDRYLSTDPTPDDAAERTAISTSSEKFGQACKAKNGELLAHVSTEEAARDMDVLRGVVGDAKINYFGASYGTFLGATYADLFPKNVGRMVLDGAIDPKLTGQQLIEGQAGGFETAFNAFVAWCVKEGSCPLGVTEEEGRQKVRDLLKSLDAKPLDARGAGPATGLDESWATYGIAAALYDQGLWTQLRGALRKALDGNGGPLMLLATQYTQRDADGRYESNMLQVINAVNCLDRGASADPAVYERLQTEYTKKWPTFGPFMAWSGMVCGVWPVKATGHAHAIAAPGSAPIVVIGTTRDPATPYEEAVSLAHQLQNGVLISRDGDGHTGYNKGNACVDRAVDGYLVRDQVPAKDTHC